MNSTLPLPKSSSHYPGETAIRIEFLSSWRVIPSTHPSIPRRRANGSPLVQLRNRGSDQRRTPRATTLPGRSGILTHLPWAYANGPPHTALPPVVRTLYLPVFWPESYYLASRSERVIRPTKCQACVQHDKRTYNDRSLAATDGVTTHLQNSARLKSN